MSKPELDATLQDSSPGLRPMDATNAERLRMHLSKDGLAAALLTAWQSGEAAGAPTRMLAALNAFNSVNPKQSAEHASKDQ